MLIKQRRKKVFRKNVDDEDIMPPKFRHIRISERKVKDDVYNIWPT